MGAGIEASWSSSPSAESAEQAATRLSARVREVRTVLAINACACVLVLVYAALTPERAHRGLIGWVAVGTLVYLGAVAAAGSRVAIRLRVGRGALAAYVHSLAVVSVWVYLDGGSSSPLNAMYLLPLALATSSAPAAGALLAVAAAASHLVAVVAAGSIAAPSVLVWVTQFALIAHAAAWIGRIRLSQGQRLRELATELQELATRDPLTRALNRRGLQGILDAAREGYEAHGPSAVLVVDLDHFKRVNDRYGHLVGDRVLIAAADAIASAVREGDLVARLGGEEFVVLLRGADDTTARTVAERVRSAVAACSEEFPVTASVGLATAVQHQLATELDAVLSRADRALYTAKAEGRDRVVTATAQDEVNA